MEFVVVGAVGWVIMGIADRIMKHLARKSGRTVL